MSVENKYTPGPWNIAPNTCTYKVNDLVKEMLCNRYGTPTSFNALAIEDKTKSKSIALIPLDDSNLENATLISAAPDLLEACKWVLQLIREDRKMYLSQKVIAMNMLMTAIAKAEGK